MELRVWWMPQVPMDGFIVPVASVKDGVWIMDVLAKYDLFQLANNIKPDYCNTGGLEMLENGEWIGWFDDETNEDNPKDYVQAQGAP